MKQTTYLFYPLLALLMCTHTWAADFYPISGVTVETEDSDLWPISNLIQGPDVGFDANEPHDKIVGGAEGNWVTAADAGFPADYIEEVAQPVIQFDLGEDRTLKEISVWGYASTNTNGTSRFSLRFATDAEGGNDGILGSVNYGQSVTYNPTFNISNENTDIQQYNLFDQEVVARYVEFTNVDNHYVSPGDGSTPDQELPAWILTNGPGGDRVGLGEVAFMDLPDTFQVGDLIPRAINGDEFGSLNLADVRRREVSVLYQTGVERGAAGDPEAGLLQEWYNDGNPGSKQGVDRIFLGDPVVPAFRGEESSWWTGSSSVDLFGDGIPDYPNAIFDGDGGAISDDGDSYSVRSTGQILIEESGVYRFTDGVDDYVYLAIDTDRSGVAGDSPGEIILNDSRSSTVLSDGNRGASIGEVEIQDVGPDGEWLAVEFNMSEGGGEDSGIIYWDYSTETGVGGNDLLFPVERTDAIFEEDAGLLAIPNTHLRSSEAPITRADVTGSLAEAMVQADVLELNIQVSPEGNDEVVVGEIGVVGDGMSILDVSDTTVRIVADGDIAVGAEFPIFVADEVIGIDAMNLLFDDPSAWNTSRLGEGILVFGPGEDPCNPNTQGDLDGNGTVEFADFLVLSGNFGNEVPSHEEGDIDCNGTVEFADFLILSANFGNDVAGAESVPEPAGLAMIGWALLAVGYFRRRR